MLKVGELAKRCDVTAETVRYYTRVGLLHPERQPGSGYKLFNRSDIHKLTFVRKAKLLGFTLSEIREIMKHSVAEESPCPLVRTLIEERIKTNRQTVDEVNALQERMENAMKQWQSMPDGIPDGDSICKLIESFTEEA